LKAAREDTRQALVQQLRRMWFNNKYAELCRTDIRQGRMTQNNAEQ